eukprot:2689685-Amphidinium_carterae.1
MNKFTGTLSAGLAQRLPTLVYLTAHHNQLGGTISEDLLAHTTNLMFFVICSNRFAGTLPSKALQGTMPGLSSANFANYIRYGQNLIEGSIPAGLFNMHFSAS